MTTTIATRYSLTASPEANEMIDAALDLASTVHLSAQLGGTVLSRSAQDALDRYTAARQAIAVKSDQIIAGMREGAGV